MFDNCSIDCHTISQYFIQLHHEHYEGRSRDFSHAIYFSLKQSKAIVLKSHFGLCKTGQQIVNESENLKAMSNIKNVNIGSLSLRLCFCWNGSPDLAYQPSPISRKIFSVQLALVDQFNHTVSADIISSIDHGSILSHQRSQKITNICTTLNFTVFFYYVFKN